MRLAPNKLASVIVVSPVLRHPVRKPVHTPEREAIQPVRHRPDPHGSGVRRRTAVRFSFANEVAPQFLSMPSAQPEQRLHE
jgi:hypothetical protein